MSALYFHRTLFPISHAQTRVLLFIIRAIIGTRARKVQCCYQTRGKLVTLTQMTACFIHIRSSSCSITIRKFLFLPACSTHVRPPEEKLVSSCRSSMTKPMIILSQENQVLTESFGSPFSSIIAFSGMIVGLWKHSMQFPQHSK